jgi:hypothetical protein
MSRRLNFFIRRDQLTSFAFRNIPLRPDARKTL